MARKTPRLRRRRRFLPEIAVLEPRQLLAIDPKAILSPHLPGPPQPAGENQRIGTHAAAATGTATSRIIANPAGVVPAPTKLTLLPSHASSPVIADQLGLASGLGTVPATVGPRSAPSSASLTRFKLGLPASSGRNSYPPDFIGPLPLGALRGPSAATPPAASGLVAGVTASLATLPSPAPSGLGSLNRAGIAANIPSAAPSSGLTRPYPGIAASAALPSASTSGVVVGPMSGTGAGSSPAGATGNGIVLHPFAGSGSPVGSTSSSNGGGVTVSGRGSNWTSDSHFWDEMIGTGTDGVGEPLPGTIIGSIAAHTERMNYAYRLHTGRSIGRGMVEGAAKNLIGKRLKQTGARWAVGNADAMASLSSLSYSDHWDLYWASPN